MKTMIWHTLAKTIESIWNIKTNQSQKKLPTKLDGKIFSDAFKLLRWV